MGWIKRTLNFVCNGRRCDHDPQYFGCTTLYDVGIVVRRRSGNFANEVYNAKLKKFYQTVILMPYLMSMVVIAYLVFVHTYHRMVLVNGSWKPLRERVRLSFV